MSHQGSLSIVLPAYNEALNIRQCLDECLNVLGSREGEVIVVNDGSNDETGKIVEQIPVTILGLD